MGLSPLVAGYLAGKQQQRQQILDDQSFEQQVFENSIRQAQLQRQTNIDTQNQSNTDRDYGLRLQEWNAGQPARDAAIAHTQAVTSEVQRAPERDQARYDQQDKQASRSNFQANLRGGMTAGAASAMSGYKPAPADIDAMVQDAIRAGTMKASKPAYPEDAAKAYGAALRTAVPLMPGGAVLAPFADQAASQVETQSPAPPQVAKTPDELRSEVMQQQLPAFELNAQKQRDLEEHQKAQDAAHAQLAKVAEQRAKLMGESIVNRKSFQDATTQWRTDRDKALATYREGLLQVANQNADSRETSANAMKARVSAMDKRRDLAPTYATVKSMMIHLTDADRRMQDKIDAGNAASAGLPVDPVTNKIDVKRASLLSPDLLKRYIDGQAAVQVRQSLRSSPEWKEVMGYDDPTSGQSVPGLWDHYNKAWQALPDMQQTSATGKPKPPITAAPAGAGGIPSVTTKAQYDALPSGTLYLHPDGTKRRKP